MQQLRELTESKESLIQRKLALKQELNAAYDKLEKNSMSVAKAASSAAKLTAFNNKKAQIQKLHNDKNLEIQQQLQYQLHKEGILKERLQYIRAFNTKFQDDYDGCQKKFQTILIRDTVVKGIKRLFLLQLCTIFFDKENQRLFAGLHRIKHQIEEETISCALGYLGLLLWAIAKVKGITLKYSFIFKGNRSYLLDGNEQKLLYSQKPSNITKLQQAYQLLLQNMNMVMEELNIQKQWRDQDVNVKVGKIGEMLWVDA